MWRIILTKILFWVWVCMNFDFSMLCISKTRNYAAISYFWYYFHTHFPKFVICVGVILWINFIRKKNTHINIISRDAGLDEWTIFLSIKKYVYDSFLRIIQRFWQSVLYIIYYKHNWAYNFSHISKDWLSWPRVLLHNIEISIWFSCT